MSHTNGGYIAIVLRQFGVCQVTVFVAVVVLDTNADEYIGGIFGVFEYGF
jgi:hypothetical protein